MQRKQLACPGAIAQHREGRDPPQHAMGILAAIFADARRIALDVSRIMKAGDKWRREQGHQPVFRPNQIFVDRFHGAPGPFRRGDF